jgi:hypothetical protein
MLGMHNAVDPYPLLTALGRRGLDQADYAELAHAVGKLALAFPVGDPARDVHDRPAALLGQYWYGVLGDDRGGHQVEVELLPQDGDLQPGSVPAAGRTRRSG